jgi:hypothetical protein
MTMGKRERERERERERYRERERDRTSEIMSGVLLCVGMTASQVVYERELQDRGESV